MNTDTYILVVDDNQENLKLVSSSLKEKGYKLALALSGNSAFKILETTKIDLILLDVMMPEMDGFEVCKRLKKDERLKEIPVIFLTAKAESEDLVKGFEAGGVDYISKPFNQTELFARVNNHIELAKARAEIIQMNQSRDKLYAIIAHDIRSPFASIILLIDMLTSEILDPSSKDYQEIIWHLKKTVFITNNLLNDLLEWTRFQTGTTILRPKKQAIYPLLTTSIGLLQANAEYKKIAISFEIDSTVEAYFDAVTTRIIFRNILSNAIKFTPKNGKISIFCTKNKNCIDLKFQDTGVGMSEDVLNRIFEKGEHFSTNGTKNEGGTGLGLFMIKDFVKKNNGKITVQSILNEGTAITISLPCEMK